MSQSDGPDNVIDAINKIPGFSLTGSEISFLKVGLDVVGKISDIAGTVSAVGAVIKLIGILAPDSGDPQLAQLLGLALKIDTELKSLSLQVARAPIDAATAQISTTNELVANYLRGQNHGPSDRQPLESNFPTLLSAVHLLLERNTYTFQYDRETFLGNAYAGTYLLEHWESQGGVEPPNLGTSVASISAIGDGSLQPQYPIVLAPVVAGITTLVSSLLSIDPYYRTTGRFRQALLDLGLELQQFARDMQSGIYTYQVFATDNNNPAGTTIQPSNPFLHANGNSWPVGAIDIFTGLRCENRYFNENLQFIFPADVNGGVFVENPDEFAKLTREQTTRDFFALLEQAPVSPFSSLVSKLEILSLPPTSSETVVFTSRRTGGRGQGHRVRRDIPSALPCEVKAVTGTRYDAFRRWQIDCTLQPGEYAGFWKIPYTFYITAFAASGQKLSEALLSPGTSVIRLKAFTFEWDVPDGTSGEVAGSVVPLTTGSARQRLIDQIARSYANVGDQPTGPRSPENIQFGQDEPDFQGVAVGGAPGEIELDVTFTLQDGLGSFDISNRSGGPNCDYVRLEVRETLGPSPGGRALVTPFELGMMIGSEYFLPNEYFGYRNYCWAKLATAIESISLRYVKIIDGDGGWDDFWEDLGELQSALPGFDWSVIGLPRVDTE